MNTVESMLCVYSGIISDMCLISEGGILDPIQCRYARFITLDIQCTYSNIVAC